MQVVVIMFLENILEKHKILSQYIDTYGHSRVINISLIEDKVVTILTPPMPIRDAPVDSTIYRIDYETLIKYIPKDRIKYQNVNADVADGLWFVDKFEYYIPIMEHKPLKDIEVADSKRPDPLSIDDYSELETFRNSKRIADILKTYSLYEFSMDPKNFGKDTYVIDKNMRYNLQTIGNRVERQKGLYRDGKIVVQSAVIRDRLISYVNVQILNNEKRVLAMKDRTNYLAEQFSNLSDFKEIEYQNVFVNRDSIEQWAKNQRSKVSRNIIYTTPQIKSIQPYFYENEKIAKEVVLVQNVEEFQDALAIGEKWYYDKINLGYYTKRQPIKKVSYKIYREDGFASYKRNETDYYVKIIEYYTGTYGVILEL